MGVGNGSGKWGWEMRAGKWGWEMDLREAAISLSHQDFPLRFSQSIKTQQHHVQAG